MDDNSNNNSNIDETTNVSGEQDNNTLPVLAHILGLFSGFIGPLIILLVADKERDKDHARMSLNWQFSFIIYAVVSFALMLVLVGFVLFLVLIIVDFIFSIVAAVKASQGELWKYPLSIRFLTIRKKIDL